MSRTPRRFSAKSGFTLVEILAAFAILGGAFVLLLAANSSAAKKEASARKMFIASMLAREVLTKTEIEGYPELGQDSGNFEEPFDEFSWKQDVSTMQIPEIFEVTITVSWPEGAGSQSIDLKYFAELQN